MHSKEPVLNTESTLLKMKGGSLKFTIDETKDVEHYAATTPIPIAYHWKEKV